MRLVSYIAFGSYNVGYSMPKSSQWVLHFVRASWCDQFFGGVGGGGQ